MPAVSMSEGSEDKLSERVVVQVVSRPVMSHSGVLGKRLIMADVGSFNVGD